MKWLASITALAALAANNPLHAQTWQTVLDYGSGTGGDWGVTADSLGNVFMGGIGSDASSLHGLVLKTDTTATTWYVSDDFNPSLPYTASDVRGLGFDSNGNLYRSGLLSAPCSKSSFMFSSVSH